MTHTSTEQPEALLKMAHYNDDHLTREEIDVLRDAVLEIRLLRARVQELEASQAQRVPLSDAECDSLIAALCPDFCDERFPGDRPILRQLAQDALNPNAGITAIDSRVTQEKQG
jgi:hypothetical protein